MKRRIAVILVAIAVLLAFPRPLAHAGGDAQPFGTTRGSVDAGATYTISSEEELAYLARFSGNYNTDYTGIYLLLTEDIAITGDCNGGDDGNWMPIASPFNGAFYGQNHTISGLDIYDCGGLFSEVGESGVVLDLKVGGAIHNAISAGGIAGTNRGLIQNCTSGVAFTRGPKEGGHVGGIAGNNHGVIQNCSNTGDIVCLLDSGAGDTDVGGIAGINDGCIVNCGNTGAIKGFTSVGGIAGLNQGGLVMNCRGIGDVGGYLDCGGILGSNGTDGEAVLVNCYTTGRINGTDGSCVVGSMTAGAADNCFWLGGADSSGFGGTPGAASVTNSTSFTGTDTLDTPVGGTSSLLEALNGFVSANPEYPMRSWASTVAYPALSGVVITQSPVDAPMTLDSTADFTALAAGDDLTYQWECLSPGLDAEWKNVTFGSRETSPTYTVQIFHPSLNGCVFRCRIMGGGISTYSGYALLGTFTAPEFTSHPQDAVVNTGGYAVFTAFADGWPEPDYQWQVSADNGATWSALSDGTGCTGTDQSELSVLTFANMDGYQYRCTATNTEGLDTSQAAMLTVNTVPEITAQPQNATVKEGGAAMFTVAASGKPSALTYQWQVSKDGCTTWSDVTTGSGAKTASYTAEAATNAMGGWRYRCVVTNKAGSSMSNDAILMVLQSCVVNAVSGNAAYGTVTGGGKFEPGASVTVVAKPAAGYRFAGWYRGKESLYYDITYTFQAMESFTLTAQFDRVGVTGYLSVQSTVYNRADVTWDAVKGAAGYQVFRSLSEHGDYTLLKTLKGRSFTDRKVNPGTQYFYKVRAYIIEKGRKVYGVSYSQIVVVVPEIGGVKGIRAKAGKASAKVSWKPVAGRTKYEVWRSAEASREYKLIGTASSAYFTDKKLIKGAQYYYKVRAYRLVGKTKVYGGWSGVVRAMPLG